jgi:hypothetical protein
MIIPTELRDKLFARRTKGISFVETLLQLFSLIESKALDKLVLDGTLSTEERDELISTARSARRTYNYLLKLREANEDNMDRLLNF